MTQRPRQQTRPLDGLRVLDLSRAVSGPFAGRILADLGADVVRAELPGTDVTQAFGKVIRGRSGLYSHVNAGKRSIVLDLHQPGDVTRLLDLAAGAGFQAADAALQTHGGFGYAKEYHVERYWREARLMRIAPVPQEMVLNYLAEHVLGLPRSY